MTDGRKFEALIDLLASKGCGFELYDWGGEMHGKWGCHIRHILAGAEDEEFGDTPLEAMIKATEVYFKNHPDVANKAPTPVSIKMTDGDKMLAIMILAKNEGIETLIGRWLKEQGPIAALARRKGSKTYRCNQTDNALTNLKHVVEMAMKES